MDSNPLESKGLTATPADASPYASPSAAENVHSDTGKSRQHDAAAGALNLQQIATDLRALLSPDDCRRLAELLMDGRE